MSVVLAVDLFAVMFFTVGFLLAFKPSVLRGAWRRGGVSEEVASALRIGGVMMMAFSVTICVFANLIAYYSAVGAR